MIFEVSGLGSVIGHTFAALRDIVIYVTNFVS